MWILPTNMLWAVLVKTRVDLILTNVENTCLKAFFQKDSWIMILPWIALMKFDYQRLLLYGRKGNYDNNTACVSW